MNTRTTLYLAIVLALLGVAYYRLALYTPAVQPAASPLPAPGQSQVARDLLESKLGDIVKIVCRKKGQEDWAFEKSKETGPSGVGEEVWRMTSPEPMKCAKWEVDGISRRLNNLQYELRYKPGEAGAVSAAAAGLEPPEATVTMTGADGKTISVEIGKPASSRETYVRLAGSNEICVGKSDLQGLLKEEAFDYRDPQLWTFAPENVTRVEIEDRAAPQSPVSYAFIKDGAKWMMESPVTAKATSKVDDMLKEMGRLRAAKWHDDDAAKVAIYGLKPAALTVRVTVEEAVQSAKTAKDTEEGDEEGEEDQEQGEEEKVAESKAKSAEPEPKPAETPPAKKVTVYELHFSDRSPIGEDTKTFMRIGDENAVATILKATADKFRPEMSKWREMRITTINVEGATRIDLTTRGGSAMLLKTNRTWSFENDGGVAESAALSELLKGIAGMAAVAFEDAEPQGLGPYGLDKPQAEIRMTIPGVEGLERITVGGYTDEASKGLVYVRRNDLTAVAKVRSSDVAKLLQAPVVYRDRTIVDLSPDRFQRIGLSTNRVAGERTDVTFQRTDSTWRMVEPVEADVRKEPTDKLVQALGGLRAQQVVAELGEPSSYGLEEPAVKVTLTYEHPTQHQPGQAVEEGAEKPGETESRTLALSFGEHGGKHFAMRSDRPLLIYEVTADLFKQLHAEYRTDRVLDFEQSQVKSLLIRSGDETHVFEKRDGRWVYAPEPDLPLDDTKVENLVLQIRDLRTERYVMHAAADLTRYALDKPQREVTVTLQDGTTHTLWVSNLADDGTSEGYYATVTDRGGVFLLTPDATKRMQVSLAELERRP